MHAIRIIRHHADMRTEQTANTQAEYDGMINYLSAEEDKSPYLVAYFCQADIFPEIIGERAAIDDIIELENGNSK
jgi:hypothetical protein